MQVRVLEPTAAKVRSEGNSGRRFPIASSSRRSLFSLFLMPLLPSPLPMEGSLERETASLVPLVPSNRSRPDCAAAERCPSFLRWRMGGGELGIGGRPLPFCMHAVLCFSKIPPRSHDAGPFPGLRFRYRAQAREGGETITTLPARPVKLSEVWVGLGAITRYEIELPASSLALPSCPCLFRAASAT